MPSKTFGLTWDGEGPREIWDLLPAGRLSHNTRAWEVQAAGAMPLDEWYRLPLWERTYKVAAMLLPGLQAALQAYERPIKLGK